MGTMGPVSEEPGLSLWDAMSVLWPGAGVAGGRLGGPRSGRGSHSPFNRKSASIWRKKRKEYETTGTLTPRVATARGRGPNPPRALRDWGLGNGPKGQPFPQTITSGLSSGA